MENNIHMDTNECEMYYKAESTSCGSIDDDTTPISKQSNYSKSYSLYLLIHLFA